MPDAEFYMHIIRQEQARADNEAARVSKNWAWASFGAAVFGFCIGLIVAGWHP